MMRVKTATRSAMTRLADVQGQGARPPPKPDAAKSLRCWRSQLPSRSCGGYGHPIWLLKECRRSPKKYISLHLVANPVQAELATSGRYPPTVIPTYPHRPTNVPISQSIAAVSRYGRHVYNVPNAQYIAVCLMCGTLRSQAWCHLSMLHIRSIWHMSMWLPCVHMHRL